MNQMCIEHPLVVSLVMGKNVLGVSEKKMYSRINRY